MLNKNISFDDVDLPFFSSENGNFESNLAFKNLVNCGNLENIIKENLTSGNIFKKDLKVANKFYEIKILSKNENICFVLDKTSEYEKIFMEKIFSLYHHNLNNSFSSILGNIALDNYDKIGGLIQNNVIESIFSDKLNVFDYLDKRFKNKNLCGQTREYNENLLFKFIVDELYSNASSSYGENYENIAKTLVKTKQVDKSNEKYLEIKIQDCGCGLRPEELNLVLNEEENYSTKNGSGHGKGLSFVKFLVENFYGGNFNMRSKKGEGTCVSFTIPKKRELYSFEVLKNGSENKYLPN